MPTIVALEHYGVLAKHGAFDWEQQKEQNIACQHELAHPITQIFASSKFRQFDVFENGKISHRDKLLSDPEEVLCGFVNQVLNPSP